VGSHKDWKQQDPQLPQSVWYFTDAQFLGFRVVRPLHEPSAEEKASKWDAGVITKGKIRRTGGAGSLIE
jgi:hypothetical protein